MSPDQLFQCPMLIDTDEVTFRAVTIGDSSVGKTSIINRFVHDHFNENEANTVGALYESYRFSSRDREFEIQVWDTAGQEQYRSLTPVYFRSASCAVLAFDLTSRPSFQSLGNWLTCFRAASTDTALIFLVGNKSDLISQRKIEQQEAQDWASENGCVYMETSAFDGSGVKELFDAVAIALVNQFDEVVPHSSRRLSGEEDGQKKGCC
jgi:small GTP-binding protein